MVLVGILSDTHHLVRPEALDALQGVELILHAGDVGSGEVLSTLEDVAPVRAVRGNTDHDSPVDRLPSSLVIEVAGWSFYLLHDLGRLDLDPAGAGISAVVFGHSHRSAVYEERGVLYLNPGSAGPRRLDLPASVARLRLPDCGRLTPWHVEIVELGARD
jgi:putative phosphoesterase